MSLLKTIASELGVQEDYLRKIARSADHRYKIYRIPKRTEGHRVIHHPSLELKLIQTWLAKNIFEKMPTHRTAFGYRKGRSILNHAMVHTNNNFLLRIDIKDFFPSIRAMDIRKLITQNIEMFDFKLSERDIKYVAKFCTRNNIVVIGSPSSPSISNTIMYDFDLHFSKLARKLNGRYTRYADDIYFSTNTPNVLTNVPEQVRSYFRKNRSPKFKINEDKLEFTSKKRRRVVTGLNITSVGQISIGREKKRHIKGLVYKFINGDMETSDEAYLKGYMSYIQSVEPNFVDRLIDKYGEEFLDELKDLKVISLKDDH